MAEYESVQRGGLKLKGLADEGVKKKKKKKSKDKDKEKKHLELELSKEDVDTEPVSPTSMTRVPYIPKKTRAELAFEKANEKRQAQMILEKASTNHKERIMELNSHLDTLTEHFDIPKVSWTK